MSVEMGGPKRLVTESDWRDALSKYDSPDGRRAAWQILNTFVPYFALWILMARLLQAGRSYWIVLALTVPAAAFLVRIFVFFHDCGHGSFFRSRWANRTLGYFAGVLTFSPFMDWRRAHATHHATSSDLDRRGVGDIWILTVEEYLAAPRLTRLAYRLYRNPLIMFGVGPAFLFLASQRIPHKHGKRWGRVSVIQTNVSLVVVAVAAGFTIGLRNYLMIQLPIAILAATAGVWLFYIQHQFEGAYWARHEEWSRIRASMEGASYYKLPKVLQWFTGNIGLHHVHHMRPRIPGYRLQECYDAIPELQAVPPVTILKSLKFPWLSLWDEKDGRLVSFRSLKTRAPQGSSFR